MASQTRTPIPACALAVALAAAAFHAPAQVHKCRNADGQTIYQEAPCEKSGTTGRKIDVTDPVAPGSGARKPAPGGGGKSMKEAYQRRMDSGDYEGALAFATTDEQKAHARQRLAARNAKCSSLSIKQQKARADLQEKGARYKPAADAAQAEYNLHCR